MTRPPAPNPCDTCPYRLDVPSGVWAASEYAKLPPYDNPTPFQPIGVFMCHQNDMSEPAARVCAGWAGCHDGTGLLALRIAVSRGDMTPEVAEAICDYTTPVALFRSGAEAAEHGMAQIDAPSPDAEQAMVKIIRKRPSVASPESRK